MVPIHRLMAAQAVVIASAVLAAIIGGVAAGSWLWALGCGVLTYAASGAVMLAWLALRIRSHWPRSAISLAGGTYLSERMYQLSLLRVIRVMAWRRAAGR